jgi:hypothetical protein
VLTKRSLDTSVAEVTCGSNLPADVTCPESSRILTILVVQSGLNCDPVYYSAAGQRLQRFSLPPIGQRWMIRLPRGGLSGSTEEGSLKELDTSSMAPGRLDRASPSREGEAVDWAIV